MSADLRGRSRLDRYFRLTEHGSTVGRERRGGLLFLAAMFFTPLYSVVPIEAAAPALVIVGALMMRQITEIDFTDFRVALPAFLTIVVMPFTYSIANGIGAGFVGYVVLAAATGRARRVHPLMWVVSIAFVGYFAVGPLEALIG